MADEVGPVAKRTEGVAAVMAPAPLPPVPMAGRWPGLFRSTSASYFNRASLIWLKQLQERLPLADTRSHQDLNKLQVALEYSVDATLNAARFASKAIASNVTSRRLLWLHQWQADVKHNWRLAAGLLSGQRHIREALDPLRIETWDKHKVLPSLSR